jgi:hypothetical protein
VLLPLAEVPWVEAHPVVASVGGGVTLDDASTFSGAARVEANIAARVAIKVSTGLQSDQDAPVLGGGVRVGIVTQERAGRLSGAPGSGRQGPSAPSARGMGRQRHNWRARQRARRIPRPLRPPPPRRPLWMRQITRLVGTHQTAIMTTRQDLQPEVLASRMFNRCRVASRSTNSPTPPSDCPPA